MRSRPIALLALLALLASPLPSLADEVVLHSGARLTGTIEVLNDKEVVIRTELGRMSFARSLVKEVRRGEEAGSEQPGSDRPASGVTAQLAWSVRGVVPEHRPAAAGSAVALGRRAGGVVLVATEDGSPVWESSVGSTRISGITADPGGVYLATTVGDVVRLNPKTGRVMWQTRLAVPLGGPPHLHRRGVFVVSPGRGLIGIESATGAARGLLQLEERLATPLASVGPHLLAGDESGRLLDFGKSGTLVQTGLETVGNQKGRALAVGSRTVAVAARDRLVVYSPEKGKVVLESPIAGLRSPPLAADSSRAYVELGGVLTAVDLRTGRVLFRASALGRVERLTATSTRLLAALADSRLASLHPANGRVRWTVPLPSRPAAPPLLIGDLTLVLCEDGTCRAYREVAGAPSPSGPAPTPPPEGPADAASARVHSPEGFTVEVPRGWVVSENATRAMVALGLRPVAEVARFRDAGATELDRRAFELSCHIALIVSPLTGGTDEQLAKRFLSERRAAAEGKGVQVASSSTRALKIGGRSWTEVKITR
ncbi:MAG: outer membrane protein assembly factor BamB family protein, partial [Planctomycetota bacterium]